MTSTKIELESIPVTVTGGLSLTMPNDALPLYLGRGPTPPGDSFKIIRQSLDIAQVKAGFNTDAANLSVDDDELTSWQSGDGSDNWIEYHLQNVTNVNQLVMKVSGHRSKTYPIKVSVDGREAFSGITATNLGYATINLKRLEGKVVRIESKKGALSIVEAELYS